MGCDTKVRYAVIGLGSIAQEAVLPAFLHAQNSELVALVSGDATKRDQLGRRYGCRTYTYEQYEECLASGKVDAVYIALPTHLHRRYAERAAKKGVHILCEKPLAPNEDECRAIIDAARAGGVNLMTAYQFHFEEANLEAIDICETGKLGEPRVFHSVYCRQVAEGNIRLTQPATRGGGPLFDLGVYCINAARHLFRDEPVEVAAFRGTNGEKRFDKSEEMISVILRFPKDRLANFTVSFGAVPTASYTVVGTKGMLTVEPPYGYGKDIRLRLFVDGSTQENIYPKRDQFAAGLIYFSHCIQEKTEPEPAGEEGLIDVQIVRAAYRSCETGKSTPVQTMRRKRRPQPSHSIERPAVEEPELLHASMPSDSKKM